MAEKWVTNNLNQLRALRRALVSLRVPTTYDTQNNPLRLWSKLALVYAGGVVVKELRSESFFIAAGKYPSITVDPILETVVEEGNSETPGARYVRYILLGPDGKHMNSCGIMQQQFADQLGGSGIPKSDQFIEYVRLDNLVIDGGLYPISEIAGGQSVLDNMCDYLDGVSLIGEEGTSVWTQLEPQISGITAPWFCIVSLNIQPSQLSAHNRIMIELGTGTTGAPVRQVRVVFWPDGINNMPSGQIAHFLFGIDALSGFSVMRISYVYPPVTKEYIAPIGTYHIFGVPLYRLSLRAANVEAPFYLPPTTGGALS